MSRHITGSEDAILVKSLNPLALNLITSDLISSSNSQQSQQYYKLLSGYVTCYCHYRIMIFGLHSNNFGTKFFHGIYIFYVFSLHKLQFVEINHLSLNKF